MQRVEATLPWRGRVADIDAAALPPELRRGAVGRAPGTTPSGGQAMMAYACCVKKRVASAGPLSERNSAFDIRSVRDRIEKDRARGEAAQLLRSLRPGAERREGEAGPSANPDPGPPPSRGETRARPPPAGGADGRRVGPRLERPQGQGTSRSPCPPFFCFRLLTRTRSSIPTQILRGVPCVRR